MKCAYTQEAILHHNESNLTAILTVSFAAVQKNTSSTPNLSKEHKPENTQHKGKEDTKLEAPSEREVKMNIAMQPWWCRLLLLPLPSLAFLTSKGGFKIQVSLSLFFIK